jgi:hypothetical protein
LKPILSEIRELARNDALAFVDAHDLVTPQRLFMPVPRLGHLGRANTFRLESDERYHEPILRQASSLAMHRSTL